MYNEIKHGGDLAFAGQYLTMIRDTLFRDNLLIHQSLFHFLLWANILFYLATVHYSLEVSI